MFIVILPWTAVCLFSMVLESLAWPVDAARQIAYLLNRRRYPVARTLFAYLLPLILFLFVYLLAAVGYMISEVGAEAWPQVLAYAILYLYVSLKWFNADKPCNTIRF